MPKPRITPLAKAASFKDRLPILYINMYEHKNEKQILAIEGTTSHSTNVCVCNIMLLFSCYGDTWYHLSVRTAMSFSLQLGNRFDREVNVATVPDFVKEIQGKFELSAASYMDRIVVDHM